MTVDADPRRDRGSQASGLALSLAGQISELVRTRGLDEGAHLTEQWIADELQVSRSPVRRALSVLEDVGIVRRVPHRGYFLARAGSELEPADQVGEHDEDGVYFRLVDDFLGGRLDQEFTAAEIARRRQEMLLRGQVLTSSRGTLFQTGAEFHEMLVGCANNPFLLDAVSRQNRIRRLIEYRHQFDRTRMVTQAREHLRLLDLLEGGRTAEAARALHAHLDRVRWIKTGIGDEPPPLDAGSGGDGGDPAGPCCP